MQPENVQNVLDVLDILDVLNVLNVSAVTYAIMIHESKYAWHLCMLLLARVLIFQTSYFADISHNAPS